MFVTQILFYKHQLTFESSPKGIRGKTWQAAGAAGRGAAGPAAAAAAAAQR